MALWKLSQGKVMLYDEEDFDLLAKYHWYAQKQGTNWYACANTRKVSGERTIVGAHSVLLNPAGGLIVDHINHDGLDNRRENLRVCTKGENLRNKIPTKATSNYKGVSWHKQSQKWLSRIKLDRKIVHLGMYDLEVHAARAYDIAAKEYHKEFAYLNNIDESIVPVPAVKAPAAKKSSQKGVYWDSHGEVWKVKFRIDGKLKTRGTFHNEEDAICCARNTELRVDYKTV